MAKALRLLLATALFCSILYMTLSTNLLSLLEGNNPDGSSSLTWKSAVAAMVVLVLCAAASRSAFRRRIASFVFLGSAGCVATWYILVNSRIAFVWEHPQVDGTNIVSLSFQHIDFGTALALTRAAEMPCNQRPSTAGQGSPCPALPQHLE